MDLELTVSEFVAVLNQTLEFAYPTVTIVGELSELKPWRDRLYFFTIKDEESSIEGMIPIAMVRGQLEVGMQVRIIATPKLTQKGRFSLNGRVITPFGEGAIQKSLQLLQKKLQAEGLFDEERKRQIPRFPEKIGLITSVGSAAYADCLSRLGERWPLAELKICDSQVQGEVAADQIISALSAVNSQNPDVILLVRGGGSAEDLSAFNDERVVRAIANSRSPVIVGVGHENDSCLSEFAADIRASTPTHAAVLATPDIAEISSEIAITKSDILESIQNLIDDNSQFLSSTIQDLERYLNLKGKKEVLDSNRNLLSEKSKRIFQAQQTLLKNYRQSLGMVNPRRLLSQGYALVTNNGQFVTGVDQTKAGDEIVVEFYNGKLISEVKNVKK
jgi:exodeoxyribonuclease VII large subunit